MKFTLNPFTGELDAYEYDVAMGDIEFLKGDGDILVPPGTDRAVKIYGGPGIEVVEDQSNYQMEVKLNGGQEALGVTVPGILNINIITFDLGTTPGVYQFELKVLGYDYETPSANTFFLRSTVRTTGAAGVEISTEVVNDQRELDTDVDAADIVNIDVSGNNMIVKIAGTDGVATYWKAIMNYEFHTNTI